MSFITCRFTFETGGWTYCFQCYEGHPNQIDIIKYETDSSGYTARLHHIMNGEIMWTSLSDYVSEDARKFGNRMVKLLPFT